MCRPRPPTRRPVLEIEDRGLPTQLVLLCLLAGSLCEAEDFEHALAGRAGRIERAALDQALDRLLVHRARIDARAEVPDGLDAAALLARLEDLLHGGVTDVLDRVEAEPDVSLDHDEVVTRCIHV